jgi:hypothetical protein
VSKWVVVGVMNEAASVRTANAMPHEAVVGRGVGH